MSLADKLFRKAAENAVTVIEEHAEEAVKKSDWLTPALTCGGLLLGGWMLFHGKPQQAMNIAVHIHFGS